MRCFWHFCIVSTFAFNFLYSWHQFP
jgi:hypothetical protein